MKNLVKTPLLLAFAASFGLMACETPTAVEIADDAPTAESIQFENEEMTAMLSSELSLTSVEESVVKADISTVNVVNRRPGWRWTLAARLQKDLTDEQKERLVALTERFEEKEVFGLVCFVGPGGLTGPDWIKRPNFATKLHILRLISDELSDEQIAQIREIQSRYHASVRGFIDAVRAGEITREEFRAELKALIESVVAEIRALLTDEQIASLTEKLEEREEKFEDLVAATKRAMYLALDASDSQISSIETLCDRVSEEKDVLFAQFESEELTREELKQALNALNEIEKEQLDVVLDRTQMEIVLIHKALLLRWRRVHLRRHRDAQSGDFNTGDGGPILGGPVERG